MMKKICIISTEKHWHNNINTASYLIKSTIKNNTKSVNTDWSYNLHKW